MLSRENSSSLELWFQLVTSMFSTSTDESTNTSDTFQEFVGFSSFKLRGTHSCGGVENKKLCINYKSLVIRC